MTALQPLLTGGRVWAAREAARARALAARALEGVARAVMQAAVVDAYAGAWTEREALAVLEDQLADAGALRAELRAILDAGVTYDFVCPDTPPPGGEWPCALSQPWVDLATPPFTTGG